MVQQQRYDKQKILLEIGAALSEAQMGGAGIVLVARDKWWQMLTPARLEPS